MVHLKLRGTGVRRVRASRGVLKYKPSPLAFTQHTIHNQSSFSHGDLVQTSYQLPRQRIHPV